MFIVVRVYFVTESVRKLLDTTSQHFTEYHANPFCRAKNVREQGAEENIGT